MATRLSEENKRLLKKWEIERKEERKSLELYRARCTADKTEMYQLLGFYIVFQGVVFNTVATSQKLTCQTSALPAVLSLLVLTGTAISVHFKLTDYESDKRRLINSENIEEVHFFPFYLHHFHWCQSHFTHPICDFLHANPTPASFISLMSK